jgi:hypothetical protein
LITLSLSSNKPFSCAAFHAIREAIAPETSATQPEDTTSALLWSNPSIPSRASGKVE